MTDTAKRILVLVLNLVAAAILGLSEIYGWALPGWGAITAVIVIVLDTWVGIEWIPPKKPANNTGGTG